MAFAPSGVIATITAFTWRLFAVCPRLLSLTGSLSRQPMPWYRPQQVQEDYLGNHMTLLLSVCGFPLARFMSRVLSRPTVSFSFMLMLKLSALSYRRQ